MTIKHRPSCPLPPNTHAPKPPDSSSTPTPSPVPTPTTTPSPSPSPSPDNCPTTVPHTLAPVSTPVRQPPTAPDPVPAIPPVPPPGLFNLGNTCYLNSVVQVLYHTPDFRAAIINWPGLSDDDHSLDLTFAADLVAALRSVFKSLDQAYANAQLKARAHLPAHSLSLHSSAALPTPLSPSHVHSSAPSRQTPEPSLSRSMSSRTHPRRLRSHTQTDPPSKPAHLSAMYIDDDDDDDDDEPFLPDDDEDDDDEDEDDDDDDEEEDDDKLHHSNSARRSRHPMDRDLPLDPSPRTPSRRTQPLRQMHTPPVPAPAPPLASSTNDLDLLRDGVDYVAPHDIIALLRNEHRCLEFDARGQQDAHEFLRFLLDKVNDCMQAGGDDFEEQQDENDHLSNMALPSRRRRTPEHDGLDMPAAKRRRRGSSSVRSPETSPPRSPSPMPIRTDLVTQLFGGKAVTATRCEECEERTERAEHFLDVSLPVEPDKSLAWALTSQGQPEVLAGDNKYKCDECHTYCEAKRWWQLAALPKVLTVHLKLFAFDAPVSGESGGKVSVAMPCPLSTTWHKWCSPGCVEKNDEYRLTAVIVHEGTDANSGHYYSYIYKADEGGWFCFDDSKVTAVAEVELTERLFTSTRSRRTAYVLFYSHMSNVDSLCVDR